MSEKKTVPNVAKLLRVLVAGGMALAGVRGARAQEQQPQAPSQAGNQNESGSQSGGQKAGADKGSGQAPDQSQADKNNKKKDSDAKKKAEDEKKKAEPQGGGGVMGW